MAVSRGEGSELFSPIAITIFGGLLTSTFLTLVIVPSIYSSIDSISRRVPAYLKRGAIALKDRFTPA
jgi:HAE1 family hydrophobic/amphiphilic exporter-1